MCVLALVAWLPPADADGEGRQQPRTNLQVCLWRTHVPGEREALKQLVFSFQRANPDVVIALEWQDAELAGEYVRRWLGSYRSHAPDVTVLPDLWAWEHRNELMPLPRDLVLRLRRQCESSVVDRAGGALRGVPWTVSTLALYYRPDLLEEAELEVPATPAELVTCADELADPPGRFGLGVPAPGRGCEELVHALTWAQGPAEDVEGDARYLPGIDLLVDLQSRGAVQPEVLTWSETELVELFADGRLGLLIARPWAARILEEKDAERDRLAAAAEAEEKPEPPPPLPWAVAPLPLAEDGSGQVQVEWLVTFADTDRPHVAGRFLRFIAGGECQRTLAALYGVPAISRHRRQFADDPRWAGHVATLPGAAGLPLGEWKPVRQRLGQALRWTLSGRLSAAEALLEAGTQEDEEGA